MDKSKQLDQLESEYSQRLSDIFKWYRSESLLRLGEELDPPIVVISNKKIQIIPFNEELYNTSIEILGLSRWSQSALKRTGITTIGEVLEMLDRGTDSMLVIRNFGNKSLDELITKLKVRGYIKP